MLLCAEAIPLMRQRDYGPIVAITSRAGQDGGPGASALSAIEASVVATVKSVATSLADTGIRANSVTGPLGFNVPDAETTAMQGPAKPTANEVASMVAWLASSECSFTSGAAYDISGGLGAY